MSKYAATLTVSYDPIDFGDNAGHEKITLQQMTNRFDWEGYLFARCFPASGVKFTATVGQIFTGEVRSQSVSEALKFSNSASAGLKYAGASGVEITPYVKMKKDRDTNGNVRIVEAYDVTLRYDKDRNEVVAEKRVDNERVPAPIFGACRVTYTADYLILKYKPGKVRYPDGGATFQVGTIFGYNNVDVATLDMELDLTSTPDWTEYARVTSKVILDAEGAHEAPKGWPETTQHEFSTKEFDPDNSFTDERVHLIVHINSFGRLRFEDFNNGGDGYWAWFDPQFGSSTWDPEYELKISTPPGGAKANSTEDFLWDLDHRTWRDVFLEVDKDALMERLEKEYPGITEGQKGGNIE